MSLTREQLKDILGAQYGSGSAADRASILAKLMTERVSATMWLGDGTAATEPGEMPIHLGGHGGKLVSIDVAFPLAIVADDTDFATITVRRRNASDPSTGIIVAQQTTKIAGSGDVDAWTKIALPLVTGKEAFSVGDLFTMEVTKDGDGIALCTASAGGLISLVYERGA